MHFSASLILFVTASAFAQSNVPPAFEVASIKPAAPQQGPGLRIQMSSDNGRINFSNVSLKNVINRAYNVKDYQISGPDWLDSVRFDIVAKIPEGVAKDKIPGMLQVLLADRFKLALHHEEKVLPVYELVAAKGGPKLQSAETGGGLRMMMGPKGREMSGKVELSGLVNTLSNVLDRPVVDGTGMKGIFEIDLKWSGDSSDHMKMLGPGPMEHEGGGERKSDEPEGVSIFTALQEKLGLKLEAKKAPVDILVIDHAEKIPTEN